MLWSVSRQFPRDFERIATMLVTLKIQVSGFPNFMKQINDASSVSAAENFSILDHVCDVWKFQNPEPGVVNCLIF